MAYITLPKGSIMKWNGTPITEHNRSDLSISFDRIENSKRMVNGTLRKIVIADKRTWACSWNNLPETAAKSVDGFWAGRDMDTFYKANAGAFALTIFDGTNTETVNVVFKNFDVKITSRGTYALWEVSLSLEEV